MVILSLGVYRISDGLVLSCNETYTNNSKVTQARALMKHISANLDRFQSRSSLYLTDCKHSIHWVTANFPSDPGGNQEDEFDEHIISPYLNKPHLHTTPSKSNVHGHANANQAAQSGFGILALCENIKKYDLEAVFFQLLNRVEKEFDERYDGFKVVCAQTPYQYIEFDSICQKLKSRFGRNSSHTRVLSKEFQAELRLRPVIHIREDEVMRLALKSNKNSKNPNKSSGNKLPPESSNSHNIKSSSILMDSAYASSTSTGASTGYRHRGNNGNSILSAANAYHASLQPNVDTTNQTDHDFYAGLNTKNTGFDRTQDNFRNKPSPQNTFFPDNSKIKPYLQRLIIKFTGRNHTQQYGRGRAQRLAQQQSALFDETDFAEQLTYQCYIVLALVIVCGALNIARAWHIATHVGENVLDDLEHLSIFIFASLLCFVQGRLVLVPMDSCMRLIGRQELNFFSLVSILLCHICVADHRHFYASLFHAVSGISVASVIHSRPVNTKSSRERA